MDLDQLIILVVLAAPGSVAVYQWDKACEREDRPLLDRIAWGTLLSCIGYLAVNLLSGGNLDLRNLVVGDKIALNQCLRPENLFIFCVLVISYGGVSWAASKTIQDKIKSITGRAGYRSVWSEVMESLRTHDTWVRLSTRDDVIWMGRLKIAPPSFIGGDMVFITSVRQFIDGKWVEQSHPALLLPVSDVKWIQLDQNRPEHSEPGTKNV